MLWMVTQQQVNDVYNLVENVYRHHRSWTQRKEGDKWRLPFYYKDLYFVVCEPYMSMHNWYTKSLHYESDFSFSIYKNSWV